MYRTWTFAFYLLPTNIRYVPYSNICILSVAKQHQVCTVREHLYSICCQAISGMYRTWTFAFYLLLSNIRYVPYSNICILSVAKQHQVCTVLEHLYSICCQATSGMYRTRTFVFYLLLSNIRYVPYSNICILFVAKQHQECTVLEHLHSTVCVAKQHQVCVVLEHLYSMCCISAKCSVGKKNFNNNSICQQISKISLNTFKW